MMTIEVFLKSLRNGIIYLHEKVVMTMVCSAENTRNEYNERIGSLKKAWALVGNDLKTHGKCRVQNIH